MCIFFACSSRSSRVKVSIKSIDSQFFVQSYWLNCIYTRIRKRAKHLREGREKGKFTNTNDFVRAIGTLSRCLAWCRCCASGARNFIRIGNMLSRAANLMWYLFLNQSIWERAALTFHRSDFSLLYVCCLFFCQTFVWIHVRAGMRELWRFASIESYRYLLTICCALKIKR